MTTRGLPNDNGPVKLAGMDWTADQIEEAVSDAIRNCDWKAVEGLLRMLAVADPARAELMHETMLVGLRMRQQELSEEAR